MGSNFTSPPRFGSPKTGPAPRTVGDWMQFFRWLWSLFLVTRETQSLQQTAAQFPFTPLAAAGAREFDRGASQAANQQRPPRILDELTAPALMALSRPIIPRPSVPTVIEDTHANRVNYPASAYTDWLYWETDTGITYISNGTNWKWVAGFNTLTQANLAAYAATLGASDAGTLAWVSDYAHMLIWTGAAWSRGPGDPEHSDTFWMFGDAPTDVGWHACDGSVVNFLKYDGTLGSKTLPNTFGTAAYCKLGSSYSSSITAAAVPTLAMNSYTPAGTISTPTFSGSPLSSHFHGVPFTVDVANELWFASTGNSWGGAFTGSKQVAMTNASGTLSLPGTTQESTLLTPAGSISTPSFTGTPATLTGTISLPGDPIANWAALHYYRQ